MTGHGRTSESLILLIRSVITRSAAMPWHLRADWPDQCRLGFGTITQARGRAFGTPRWVRVAPGVQTLTPIRFRYGMAGLSTPPVTSAQSFGFLSPRPIRRRRFPAPAMITTVRDIQVEQMSR